MTDAFLYKESIFYLYVLFMCSIVLLLLYKLATNSVSQRLF